MARFSVFLCLESHLYESYSILGFWCSWQSAIQLLILGFLWLKVFFGDTFLLCNICLFCFFFFKFLLNPSTKDDSPKTSSRLLIFVRAYWNSYRKIRVKIDKV